MHARRLDLGAAWRAGLVLLLLAPAGCDEPTTQGGSGASAGDAISGVPDVPTAGDGGSGPADAVPTDGAGGPGIDAIAAGSGDGSAAGPDAGDGGAAAGPDGGGAGGADGTGSADGSTGDAVGGTPPEKPVVDPGYVEQKDDGDWPVKPRPQPDGSVWYPHRVIPDGKGGKLVLRNPPPLIKPERTVYDPAAHQPGTISIILRDGADVALVDGRFVDGKGKVPASLQAVLAQFAGVLGPIAPTFSGAPAKLQAERLAAEQKTGKAFEDLSRYFVQAVHGSADLAAIADLYNDSHLVALARPLPRGGSEAQPIPVNRDTASDTGQLTGDFTIFQRYLLDSAGAPTFAGGHNVTYAWSVAGGRGEGASGGQIENAWNRNHEDLDAATATLYAPYSVGGAVGQTSTYPVSVPAPNEDEVTRHDMGVLGAVKAANNGIGLTGIASEAAVKLMPDTPADFWSWAEHGWSNPLNIDYGDLWRTSVRLRHMANTLPAGAVIWVSRSWFGPNVRGCPAGNAANQPLRSRTCQPRAECIPAPTPGQATPYRTNPDGSVMMRCEAYDDPGLANNACATDADCQTRWGFGARCLPVPHNVGFWGVTPNWRCGGDSNGKLCTTAQDCESVARCVHYAGDFSADCPVGGACRCGGFNRTWNPPANPAPAWVHPTTAGAGNVCNVPTDCVMPPSNVFCTNDGDCRFNGLSGAFRPPFEFFPEMRAAIRYTVNDKGIAFVMAAANHRQRLGLLHNSVYDPPEPDGPPPNDGNPLALVGHDQYKIFYNCPFPGCGGPTGGWMVAGTAGAETRPAGFSNRGPPVQINGWAEQFASFGIGAMATTIMTDAGPGPNQLTNTYEANWSGTSFATPAVAALALSLQGIAKAAGAVLTPAELLTALQAGAIATVPLGVHENIAVRPLMDEAVKHLAAQGKAPAGAAALTPPALVIEGIGAASWTAGTDTELGIAIHVRNDGQVTSPPLGLRLTLGEAGTGAPGPKAAVTGMGMDLLYSCVDHAHPNTCCADAPDALAGCEDYDLDRRRVLLPFVDGKAATPGNVAGRYTAYFRTSVPKVAFDALASPEVCVALDREARNGAVSRLHPGDAGAADPTACGIVDPPPDVLGLSSGNQLEALAFAANPQSKICGLPAVANDPGVLVHDFALTTRRHRWALMTYPHTGAVGLFDWSTCKEHDFDPKNDVETCKAPPKVNRLTFVPELPGEAPCSPANVAAKLGYNPMGIAVSRDQRYAAVALGHINDTCAPGRLAILDLTDGLQPRILQEDDGLGGKKHMYVEMTGAPVAVAFSHEGTKDARIVVAHGVDISKCGYSTRVSVLSLADVLANKSKAKVTWKPILYPCPGALCAAKDPKRMVIDKDNLAAFITMSESSNGGIAMLRLSDATVKVFHSTFSQSKFDRPEGLDVLPLGGGKVRVVFTGYSFYDKTEDWSGNKCPTGYTCGGVHWIDVDVPAGTHQHSNAGRLIPGMTYPRDIALNAAGTQALVVSNASKKALVEINGWTGMVTSKVMSIGGGKRLLRPPPADNFCPEEVCNDADDDCDGLTDETWPHKGDPCSAGQGICHAVGQRVCTADGLALRCSATAGAPAMEKCNGLDDDCDGVVDDPWNDQLGEPCGVGQGLCRREGKKQCGGGGLVCSASPGKPAVEACNGQDDDCDGQTDEEGVCPPEADPCEGQTCSGQGSCQSSGGAIWCQCNAGHAAFGMSCAKQADVQACLVSPPPYEPCPAACTGGCLGALCIIRCADASGCAGGAVSCPKDRPCRVDCVGEGACEKAQIACQGGLICDLRCLGKGSCAGAELSCGPGFCTTVCSPVAGKLAKRDCSGACACAGGCVAPP